MSSMEPKTCQKQIGVWDILTLNRIVQMNLDSAFNKINKRLQFILQCTIFMIRVYIRKLLTATK